jgi:tetratricopeptide (TPR) repeat protein
MRTHAIGARWALRCLSFWQHAAMRTRTNTRGSRVPLTVLLSLWASVPGAAEPATTATTTTTTTTVTALPAHASESRWPTLEAAYASDRHDEGLREAKAQLALHPDDVELLALYARFLYEEGERHKRDGAVDKRALYEEMVGTLSRARALSPTDARVGWGLGIAKARLGTTRGVLSSLSMAREIERLWLEAARSDVRYVSLNGEEKLPCDAYLTLGIFYRLIPDWWIVEVVAGTRGDVDKALTWLRRANQCAPEAVRTHKELGVGLLCAAERRDDPALVKEAQQAFAKGLAITPRFHTERVDHQDMRRLLTTTKGACGYSRDGQQTLDESAMPTR